MFPTGQLRLCKDQKLTGRSAVTQPVVVAVRNSIYLRLAATLHPSIYPAGAPLARKGSKGFARKGQPCRGRGPQTGAEGGRDATAPRIRPHCADSVPTAFVAVLRRRIVIIHSAK